VKKTRHHQEEGGSETNRNGPEVMAIRAAGGPRHLSGRAKMQMKDHRIHMAPFQPLVPAGSMQSVRSA
jgi:hypothetical protein